MSVRILREEGAATVVFRQGSALPSITLDPAPEIRAEVALHLRAKRPRFPDDKLRSMLKQLGHWHSRQPCRTCPHRNSPAYLFPHRCLEHE